MILCNSALYTDVLNGKTESHESVLHKLEAIAQIKLGLQASPVVSDALIGAVACLAKAEVSLPSYIRSFCTVKVAYGLALVCFGELRNVGNSSKWPDSDGGDPWRDQDAKRVFTS